MEGLSPSIVTAALAAATIAKILVDLVRMTNKLPAWSSPILAVVFGVAAAFLLQLAAGTEFTSSLAAQSVLAGIVAASTAIGSTELQKREKTDLTELAQYAGTLMTTDDLVVGDHEA
ncbi:hypothetical protein K2Z83_13540 [Oscillochloris sp. ZM17-4]|uniref:hypothetical protein n=1 Tax=Oscillochloris sp. ZM17-4 TaxID=2866714 RepID=UPI001C739B8B|nr:hypothetical protein [Oscillochloris sp. ZM17-4]MBX0328700.1 hypothetical protein [Oscillochloris sp. ZM17-4]